MNGKPLQHREIKWNPVTEQWSCTICARSSDHTTIEDARVELEQFDCELPEPSAEE